MGASPMVFSSFTRTLFPEMLGMRIIRTVLPLIVGVVALALCDIAQAVNQSFSPAVWFVAQPASVSKATARMLEIFLFDSMRFSRFRQHHPNSRIRARFAAHLRCIAMPTNDWSIRVCLSLH